MNTVGHSHLSHSSINHLPTLKEHQGSNKRHHGNNWLQQDEGIDDGKYNNTGNSDNNNNNNWGRGTGNHYNHNTDMVWFIYSIKMFITVLLILLLQDSSLSRNR